MNDNGVYPVNIDEYPECNFTGCSYNKQGECDKGAVKTHIESNSIERVII